MGENGEKKETVQVIKLAMRKDGVFIPRSYQKSEDNQSLQIFFARVYLPMILFVLAITGRAMKASGGYAIKNANILVINTNPDRCIMFGLAPPPPLGAFAGAPIKDNLSNSFLLL